MLINNIKKLSINLLSITSLILLLIILPCNIESALIDYGYTEIASTDEYGCLILEDFTSMDELIVEEKRGNGSLIDIRDFIKPEEARDVLVELDFGQKREEEKVAAIYQYISEMKNIDEKEDYWQYPAETLEKGGGDCEDKVFLLLSVLLEEGINDVYAVKGRYLGGGHFWVEYKDKILNPSRKTVKIISAKKALGYTPFFKFNQKDVYKSNKL